MSRACKRQTLKTGQDRKKAILDRGNDMYEQKLGDRKPIICLNSMQWFIFGLYSPVGVIDYQRKDLWGQIMQNLECYIIDF